MIASARILQGQRERERQREMHEHKYVISKILLWVRNRISIVKKKKKIKRHQRSNFTSFVSSDSKIHCAFNTQLKWPKELKIFYKRKKKLSKMASKLISIFLGLQCWSPALLPCPFPHTSDGKGLESTSLHTFLFLAWRSVRLGLDMYSSIRVFM